MNTFTLHLQSAEQYRKIDQVVSLVASDASGSTGILAQHERMLSILNFGLLRYRGIDDIWHYAALPGGVLYFNNNELFISTRQFILGDDAQTMTEAVKSMLADEQETLHGLKHSIIKLEQEVFRRLWQLQHHESFEHG